MIKMLNVLIYAILLILILAESKIIEQLNLNINVIACVGDSITYGSGATDRNFTSYPSILQTLLGEDNYKVYNNGLGSATALKSSIFIKPN